MKRITAILISLITVLALFILPASAETVKIYVTVSDAGNIVLASEAISVSDVDGDGVISLDDALSAAHTQCGKEYGSVNSDYGRSMVTLWGITNGGWYGYYINNASPMSLLDPVKDGDSIYAYTYSDTTYASDMYAFFEISDGTLTLNTIGFDSEWNVVTAPLSDAVITLDGVDTEYKTDSNGKTTLPTSDVSGRHIVSARKDGAVLVPPVYVFDIADKGLSPIAALLIVMGIAAIIAVALVIFVKKSGIIKHA